MALLFKRQCDGCKKDYRGRGRKFCSWTCRDANRDFKGFPGNQFAKGHHWKLSTETRARQGAWQKGDNHRGTGWTQSIETRRKISLAHRARVAAGIHHAWKGGITPEHRKQRLSIEYKLWRGSVFKRDNYTCQMCDARNERGTGNDIYLEADHIKRFADFPELRLDINNGRTLCRPCHRKVTLAQN